jgi:hypothetical protein
MRNDAVQAAVVFVDRLVTALTVAIEGTFNSDCTNGLRTQTHRGVWGVHSASLPRAHRGEMFGVGR